MGGLRLHRRAYINAHLSTYFDKLPAAFSAQEPSLDSTDVHVLHSICTRVDQSNVWKPTNLRQFVEPMNMPVQALHILFSSEPPVTIHDHSQVIRNLASFNDTDCQSLQPR